MTSTGKYLETKRSISTKYGMYLAKRINKQILSTIYCFRLYLLFIENLSPRLFPKSDYKTYNYEKTLQSFR